VFSSLVNCSIINAATQKLPLK